MSYRWKPSKSARRQFAKNMQNKEFADAYYERKEARAEKRRLGSSFDYNSAGGAYVPTQFQNESAFKFLSSKDLTPEQTDACNQVISGYSCNEKIHHDYIHVLNELIRNNFNR